MDLTANERYLHAKEVAHSSAGAAQLLMLTNELLGEDSTWVLVIVGQA
jgi:hypothetical protein